MKFSLEINMDNSAFDHNPFELLDILDRLSTKELCVSPVAPDYGIVKDSNGNAIGEWSVSE